MIVDCLSNKIQFFNVYKIFFCNATNFFDSKTVKIDENQNKSYKNLLV